MTPTGGARAGAQSGAHAVPPRIPRPAPAPRAQSPRIDRLAGEVAASGTRAVDAFWREADAAGTPLIEECAAPEIVGERAAGGADEVIATFLWRGTAETRRVTAFVNKLHDPADPAASAMRNVAGTDVWWLSYRLPSDWRGSYHVVAEEGDGAETGAAVPVPDPLNPDRLPQPAGTPAKSVASMPSAPAAHHLVPAAAGTCGAVTETGIDSAVLGGRRRVWVHTPQGGTGHGGSGRRGTTGYPLLVLLDGDMWFETLGIAPALDRLTAEGTIPPMVAVGVDALDRASRAEELACHGPFVRFLVDELLPWAQSSWGAGGDPDRTIIAGQSLGGLAALHAAATEPDRIGRVLAQSPSLWWGGRDGDRREEWLTDRLARSPRLPRRIYLEVGCDEWVNVAPARRLRQVLAGRDCRLDYREFSGGHDRACWRVGIAAGLAALTAGVE